MVPHLNGVTQAPAYPKPVITVGKETLKTDCQVSSPDAGDDLGETPVDTCTEKLS